VFVDQKNAVRGDGVDVLHQNFTNAA